MLVIFFLLRIPIVLNIISLKILGPNVSCTSEFQILENIKKLRNKMLLTQQELAKLLSVAYVSINRWENGVHEPTMKAKRELMKLFKEIGIVEE